MSATTVLSLGVAALQLQYVLASPMGPVPVPAAPSYRHRNETVSPHYNVTPIITEIESMTQEEYDRLVKEMQGVDVDRRSILAARNATSGTDGALLTYYEEGPFGEYRDRCEAFEILGPFTSIQVLMGSSNVNGFRATSYTGNSTEVLANDTVVDPGEFKFADNERITKFSIARLDPSPSIQGFKFETDVGNSYNAVSDVIKAGNSGNPTYEDINVGSGILGRIRGTNCQNVLGVFGEFGIDFLDELDSISISNIDYSGFTRNIMPTGPGAQLSVGSQILDNRNSSLEQTIALTTTDAITRQTTITTQVRVQVGSSVTVQSKVSVPFLSEGSVTTEANWQLETLTVSSIRPSNEFCFPG